MKFSNFSTALVTTAVLGACPLFAQAETANKLTLEKWYNLSQYPTLVEFQNTVIAKRAPHSTSLIDGASVSSVADRYGARMRGHVTAPVTGVYRFYIAGDNSAALWLSTDDKVYNKKQLAYVNAWTAAKQWTKFSTQKSVEVQLVAGQKYYIEAQLKETFGADHVSIAWEYVSDDIKNWVREPGVTSAQSSVGWGGQPGRAIDGNTNGNYNAGSVTHTVSDQNAWWSTNLGVERSIEKVVLHNRNIVKNRLSNFKVSVLNAAGAEVASKTFYTDADNTNTVTTWELPNAVQGQTVKVELLGYNRDGNGYLSIAEVEVVGSAVGNQPLASLATIAIEQIPANFLSSYAAPAEDSNDNGLPDSYESDKGILPGANANLDSGKYGEYGDFDGDGLSNAEERLFSSNPAVQDSISGKLTKELWSGLGGYSVKSLTDHDNFKFYPHSKTLVEGVNSAQEANAHFGARYKGMITAPVTGEYTFWIAGDDEAELWLSDGSIKNHKNIYGKKKIAWIHDERFGANRTAEQDFDRFDTQRSVKLQLAAGESYYFEVLHKDGGYNDNVAVAWQKPDASREIIPASVFKTYLRDTDDGDSDSLPDAWEIINGLSPHKSGYGNPKEGEYGDKDGDGLTNLQEYQLGTHPNSEDSDNDGIKDFEEVNYFKTDPTKSNVLSSSTHTEVSLEQFADSSNPWIKDSNNHLVSQQRRGYISYDFVVAEGQEGIFEMNLQGGISGENISANAKIRLEYSLNGKVFSSEWFTSPNGQSVSSNHLTPWLSAGSYRLSIDSKNYNVAHRLRIESVTVKKLGGLDANSDGYPDWAKEKVDAENYTVKFPAQSTVSPVFIEGRSTDFSSTTLKSKENQLPWLAGPNFVGFANVDLDPETPTPLTLSMQNGAKVEAKDVSWVTTDMLTQAVVELRLNDSLKLGVAPKDANGDSIEGTFTMTHKGISLPHPENDNFDSTEYHIFTFRDAGEHSFEVTFTPADESGEVITQQFVAIVHSVDLADDITALAWNERDVTMKLSTNYLVEVDERMTFEETTNSTTAAGSRAFKIQVFDPKKRYFITRVPSTGQIIDRGVVNGFYLAATDETQDVTQVEQYADGTYRMKLSIVADNFPANVSLKIRTYYQGIMFEDGSFSKTLTASDFDNNGIANFYLENPNQPKTCHYLDVILSE